MTYNLKDVGERGIPLSLDLGERPQVLFTDPEWKMEDGMKLDDGPGWAMKTSGPDWGMNLDGGPGWQMQFTGPDWELKMDGGIGWNPMTLLHEKVGLFFFNHPS
ncbi:hypothetical protein ABH14_28705 [Brevibacillus brevis]|uniref:hypothetical protein n=1 Tax=Brevibacillus brevis TaxID=1393 RepID=UPI0019026342|nr:hypothetical protein [Brevibacillus brevis]MBH0333664.1 hypothetical protein [Brevibacillus brevis]